MLASVLGICNIPSHVRAFNVLFDSFSSLIYLSSYGVCKFTRTRDLTASSRVSWRILILLRIVSFHFHLKTTRLLMTQRRLLGSGIPVSKWRDLSQSLTHATMGGGHVHVSHLADFLPHFLWIGVICSKGVDQGSKKEEKYGH